MEQHNTSGPRIRVLADRVAKIIAAGEVIDRPFSVVRELLDNSLDSGASDITLYTDRGGMDSIRVTDNGCGMSEEDLGLCWLPHATSKIVEEDDIYRIRTLGFRGEALSSIGTCSRLEIASAREGDRNGHRLIVHGGKLVSVCEAPPGRGTAVSVSDIFYNMPARKKFLKTANGEQAMCKAVFTDKALPFENVSFRLFAGKELKLFLPPAQPAERVAAVYADSVDPKSLSEEELVGDEFSIHAVLARPEEVRKDKRLMQVFVNKRRIYDYALVQAIEYGYAGFVPGKDNPIAFVFVDIAPELVDFNIHPAKKECRIRNMQALHKELVRLVKGFVSRFSISIHTSQEGSASDVSSAIGLEFDEYKDTAGDTYTEKPARNDFTVKQGEYGYGSSALSKGAVPAVTESFTYIGQAFDLFLIVEKGDTIYLIDQHAAHERILFEKFKKEKQPSQELLFPIAFDATAEETAAIQSNSEIFAGLGIKADSTGKDTFEITALPAHLVPVNQEELVRMLKTSPTGSFDEFEDRINAMAACRTAIKEGEKIDPVTGLHLAKSAFCLDNARCPHGRPIWFTLTKDRLYNLLGRK